MQQINKRHGDAIELYSYNYFHKKTNNMRIQKNQQTTMIVCFVLLFCVDICIFK